MKIAIPSTCGFLLSYDNQTDRQSILENLFFPKNVTQELRMTASAPRDSIENVGVYCLILSETICKRI